MTQFLCKKHGMQSAVFTSPNVQQKMLRGEHIRTSDLQTIKLQLLSEIPGIYKVDDAFVEENKRALSDNTEESEFEIECRLVPICASCYREQLSNE